MQTVTVILAQGFEEIEAITIIDVLRRAEIPVSTVSISDQLEVNGAHGINVIADKLFDAVNFKNVGMIVLPGGMPGSANLDQHQGLKDQIISFHKEQKTLAAICAAPLVFGKLGILSGESATCYPGFEEHLQGANLMDAKTVVSGNIITGKGAGVAMDFALKIVEILKDKTTSDLLATKMIAS